MKILIISFSLLLFTSCLFQEKHPDVDSFYTEKAQYEFPRIPLIKPFYLTYHKVDSKWYLNYPTLLKYGMSPSNTDTIGVNKHFLYGYIQGGAKKMDSYEKGDYVYLDVIEQVTVYLRKATEENNLITLKPIDLTKKTFKIPNRWFVVNTKDSISHVFLSKSKYKDFLKENGIAEKKYYAPKMHKQFKDTGILPWFPDSIKVKLSK